MKFDQESKIDNVKKIFGSFVGGNINIQKNDSGFYASRSKFVREGNKVKRIGYEYLGRVISLEDGIFYNNKRGKFKFTEDDGYQDIHDDITTIQKEKYILEFGGMWIFDQILKKSNLDQVIDNIIPHDKDNLKSLLAYILMERGLSLCYAESWFIDSYARILYPEALPKSQRISEFLHRLGNDSVTDRFFKLYLTHISHNEIENGNCKLPVIIDSTGVPNNINVPVTAISNHNGDINNEFRLIYVVDQLSGLPIYFRYIAGNIIDISTLGTTIKELSLYGIDILSAVLDAGYYSSENIRNLFDLEISFVMRMTGHRTQFKELIKTHGKNLRHFKNAVKYRNKILYVKKVLITLEDEFDAFAYIILDPYRLNQEEETAVLRALEDKSKQEKIQENMIFHGKFILVSNKDLEVEQILPFYFQRQLIEQIFDVLKNNACLLPVRVHSDESIRAFLIISFLVTTIYLKTNLYLKDSRFSAKEAFFKMNKLKVKIFDKENVIQEPTKIQKEILQKLKIQLPFPIESNSSKIPREIITKKRGRPKGSIKP
jgi:hypothetical protein